MVDRDAIRARFAAVEPFLDERVRRLVTASEARAAGHGGIEAVSAATGIECSTIGRGLSELAGGSDGPPGLIRRAGARRKLTTEKEKQPDLLATLRELVTSGIGKRRCCGSAPWAECVPWSSLSRKNRHVGRPCACFNYHPPTGRLLARLPQSAVDRPHEQRRFQSGAALATVVGVLVEVPVML